jgi:hypothetical protein
MEWLTNLLPALNKFPWWVGALLIGFGMFATTGINALLRYLGFGFELEKYRDGRKEKQESALVTELKDQVKELRADLQTVLSELKTVREKHTDCEIKQATLQGKFEAQAERMNAMQIQIDGLMRHDQANKENKAVLKDAIKKFDPEAAADLK